jgi:hypothetical protein
VQWRFPPPTRQSETGFCTFIQTRTTRIGLQRVRWACRGLSTDSKGTNVHLLQGHGGVAGNLLTLGSNAEQQPADSFDFHGHRARMSQRLCSGRPSTVKHSFPWLRLAIHPVVFHTTEPVCCNFHPHQRAIATLQCCRNPSAFPSVSTTRR